MCPHSSWARAAVRVDRPAETDIRHASASLVVDIKTYCAEQHQPLDHLLVVDADAEDRHAVIHHAHDQGADHSAGHPADDAIGRGTANEAGGDDVELEAGPGFRCCGVEPRGEPETSERG